MVEQNKSILDNLKDIQSLRGLLKSEVSINGPGKGEVIAKIKVYNDAPASPDGGDVVFTGVGLRITDGREGSMKGRVPTPSNSRPSDRAELRQKYNEGTWIGGRGGSFPEATADERSYGEILFPGESVIYEMKIPETDLSYLEIRVEGSVSRRHLFHISQPMEALKAWTQPLIIETFRALDAIDFYTPLLAIVDAVPKFDPQTTLAEIDTFRVAVGRARDHLGKVWRDMDNVSRSAPNQKLRDFMNKYGNNGIGKYLAAATKMCDRTLEALSGSDTRKIKEAAEELKAHVLKSDEVKREQMELMSQFGIDYHV